MSHSQFDQQDEVPGLLPIANPKKNQSRKEGQTHHPVNSSDAYSLPFKDPNKQSSTKLPYQPLQSKIKQEPTKLKLFENKFEDKTNFNKKQGKPKDASNENQKAKGLISDMLHKISFKNISEQLYPVSNEVIDNLIVEIQKEISVWRSEKEKKQSLSTNQSDLIFKKQLTAIEVAIKHCNTIRDLYKEKIEFRNKVAMLEGKILELRGENRDLKIKVTRGIETIASHMHNLPCEREKQYKEQLNRCVNDFNLQVTMRQNLQHKIKQIINNFHRFYQEANQARLVVIRKLKEVQQREKLISDNLNQKPNQHTIAHDNLSMAHNFSLASSIRKNQIPERDKHKQINSQIPDQSASKKPNQISLSLFEGANISQKLYQNYYRDKSKTPNKPKPEETGKNDQKLSGTFDDKTKKNKSYQGTIRTIKKL